MAAILSVIILYFVTGIVALLSRRFYLLLSWTVAAFGGAAVSGLFFKLAEVGTCSYFIGGWGMEKGIQLFADRYSLYFAMLAVILNFAALLFVRAEPGIDKHFYALLNFLFGTVYALSFSRDLFNIYVVFELLTLTSFLLVGYERRAAQIWASLKYLFICSFAMSLYLLGVGVIYRSTGSLNMEVVLAQVPVLFESGEGETLRLGFLLVFTGVAIKSGVLFFSMWLPAAHSYAPSVVSALLSGLVIKMGIYVLLRVGEIFKPLPVDGLLIGLGLVTGLGGVIYAIAAEDIKKILAFHTLSQMGYILLGLGLATPLGMSGAFYHLINHGLFKGLLFLASGHVIKLTGKRKIGEIKEQTSSLPLAVKAALILGSLAIIGFPPLNGFVSKSLLEGEISSPLLKTLFIGIALGTAISFSKFLTTFWNFQNLKGIGGSKLAAYGLLGGLIILLGSFPRVVLERLFGLASPGSPYSLSTVGEALAIFGGGLFIYLFGIRRAKFKLSEKIFSLENSLLIILSAFLLIYYIIR